MVMNKFLKWAWRYLKKMDKKTMLKEWMRLKKKEKEYSEKRKNLEKEIELMFPFENSTSQTFKIDDLKVSIKKNSSYKFIMSEWEEARKTIPVKIRPERIKYEVDMKKFNDIKDTEYYISVSNCIEMKQTKSTISVEREV